MTGQISVVLGGPVTSYPDDLKNRLTASRLVIGVDYGAQWLLDNDITPDIAIGDFDSVDANQKYQLKNRVEDLVVYPTHKDYTDGQLGLMKAVELLKQSEADDLILVYGATGGRLDHLFSNLVMVLASDILPYIEKIKLIDKSNEVVYINGGRHQFYPKCGLTYFSVIPLTGVSHLTITDAKYPLIDFSSEQIQTFISNEFEEDKPIEIQLKKGIVAIIYSKD
ncbi:thiamine diphosphokinase [Holzapfeliella sp. He02]|uniref:Thiamine diphosphokinase n=1 Tax=Holzapfeliella saturejae TaxID=3082953 RepID=A0ABU8SGV1_9LACO